MSQISMFVKAGVCCGQAVMENVVQVSGGVVDGVPFWKTNSQCVRIIVCHKFRRYIMHFWWVH